RLRGSVTIEIGITAVLVVLFAVLAWNMCMAVWGFTNLDAAARDAARAAASTNNQNSAITAAQQSALAHRTDGYFVTQPTVARSEVLWVTNPNNTNPPSGSPYVVVTARCQVLVPAFLNFFGASSQSGQIAYARTYVYPILGATFTPPPNTNSSAPP